MAKIAELKGSIGIFAGVKIDLKRSASVDEVVHYPRYELAADASAESVGFGPVTTASVVAIATDNQITYTFNSDGEAHTLSADSVHVFFGDSITSLALTEPNSAACVLEILIAGT